jgi:hypothetical protein
VVAEDPAGPEQLADHPLGHQAQHGRRRGAAPVVTLSVMRPDHPGAYERWVRDPGQDLPALVDESFAALAGLAG